MYYVNGKRFEEASTKNQKIISLFLKREQIHDMTSWVKYVMSMAPMEGDDAPFTFADMQKGYPDGLRYECPNCGFDVCEVTLRSGMVEPIYRDAFGEWECPVCGTCYDNKPGAESCCEGETIYWCEDCNTVLTEADIHDYILNFCEGYDEWWMVSDWLGEKLAERGEYIISADGMKLWGRDSNDKDLSITDDPEIRAICVELEILEGQKHAWPVQ